MMNPSLIITLLFLIGLFLELSSKQHSYVDRRSAQVVDIGEPNPCQPDTPRNRQIMDWYLNLSPSHEKRVLMGTGHLNLSQIELLADTTTACAFLKTDMGSALFEVLPDTAEQKYDFTFYKVGNFYFGTQSFHQSSNPNRNLVFGLNFFYVYDNNLRTSWAIPY